MGENIFDKINQNYFHQIFKTKNKKQIKRKNKMVAWHLLLNHTFHFMWKYMMENKLLILDFDGVG